MIKVQTIKGMNDILPADLLKMEYVESLLFKSAAKYGFSRVQTPILESAEIYKSTAEFPEEKCYSLSDSKGRKMVLRSDPDAPLVRLVANNWVNHPKPIKLSFCGSIFRSWNIHRREFKMFSLSTFGLDGFVADVEILRIIADVMEEIGFSGHRIEFNNLNLFRDIICAADRAPRQDEDIKRILHDIRFAADEEAIAAILRSSGLSENIIAMILDLFHSRSDEPRIYEILDKASKTFPALTPELEKTLSFKASLASYGLQNCHLNVSNLHGTGFYSGLTYRIFSKNGSKEIGDGGRYDQMMERIQGRPMPATGIGLGIERFVELIEAEGLTISLPSRAKNMIIAFAGSELADRCRPILRKLRSAGYIIEEDLASRDLDKVMRYAKTKQANRVIMIKSAEPEALHLKIIDLDEDKSDSLLVNHPEELYDVLLKC